MELSFEYLRVRQRALREAFPESLGLRTHRAMSWLQRAKMEADDPNARFVFPAMGSCLPRGHVPGILGTLARAGGSLLYRGSLIYR